MTKPCSDTEQVPRHEQNSKRNGLILRKPGLVKVLADLLAHGGHSRRHGLDRLDLLRFLQVLVDDGIGKRLILLVSKERLSGIGVVRRVVTLWCLLAGLRVDNLKLIRTIALVKLPRISLLVRGHAKEPMPFKIVAPFVRRPFAFLPRIKLAQHDLQTEIKHVAAVKVDGDERAKLTGLRPDGCVSHVARDLLFFLLLRLTLDFRLLLFVFDVRQLF